MKSSNGHAYINYLLLNYEGFSPDRLYAWLCMVRESLDPSAFDGFVVNTITRALQVFSHNDISKFVGALKRVAPDGLERLVPDFNVRLESAFARREQLKQQEILLKEKHEKAVALAEKQESLRSTIMAMFGREEFSAARAFHKKESCHAWWSTSEFERAEASAKALQLERLDEAKKKLIEEQRQVIKSEICRLIAERQFEESDDLYESSCTSWWPKDEYNAVRLREIATQRFVDLYQSGGLADLDALFRSGELADLPVADFIELKIPLLRKSLATIGMTLDEEQERASARPEARLQIKARAGSGKTRTLSARAALAIHDEKLDPNQVLILAFNKAAATEVGDRVQKMLGGAVYENARTFHSLAYQLVKPQKELLFDAGGNPSAKAQSQFAQRMMQRILNPTFKEAMVAFFRKELEQIESIGRDLPPADYYVFRRSLEHVTLGAQRVKSNGEKFISDFFFEHDIEYRYERAWMWKTPFLDGVTYKPDFSILANGKDYILEHWALDPDDLNAKLPQHWSLTAPQYRKQIDEKRKFWQSKNIQLLETHTGMMAGGRELFENQLKSVLDEAGIRCQRLPDNEIVERVFQNNFVISRMATLFLQFIQRAKRRGWSVDAVTKIVEVSPDDEPRARLFHQLALRAYREYEVMLAEEDAMDFDDLLNQATEAVIKDRGAASIHLGGGRMMPIRDLRWILLDEYQDFSELYFRMLEAVLKANPDVRLVAVGDDWQAINTFAGAELRFFNRFADFFSGAQSVGITTNYRSDRQVVAAGNQLMSVRGAPAKISRSARSGMIQVIQLSCVWVQFVRAGHEDEWEADQVYLPPGTDGKASEAALRQAQAFKTCVEVLLPALEKEAINETAKMTGGRPFAMLLSRTGYAYGLEIADFRRRLIDVLEIITKSDRVLLERLIEAMTAHGSKGREAHTVIILEATDRQFPKVHPDNLLFQLFGVTPKEVLEEERRLFYVAITRAEHRLIVLTDKEAESPYLGAIRFPVSDHPDEYHDEGSWDFLLGPVARQIKERIDALNPTDKQQPAFVFDEKLPF